MKAAVVCHIVQRVLSTVWYLMDLTVGQATITAARYLLLAAVAPGVVVFVQHSLNQAGQSSSIASLHLCLWPFSSI